MTAGGPWPFALFSTWIWVWTWSCSLTYAYQIWHKGVLPWGNLKLHYITSEWSWPLNSRLIFVNMLVAGVSFVRFTHSFRLVEQVCTTSRRIWDDKYIQSNNQLFSNWKNSKIKYWQYFIYKINQICIMDYYNTCLIEETKYNAF